MSISEQSKENSRIRVAIRVRPANGYETSRISVDAERKLITLGEQANEKEYGPFDQVYDQNWGQEDIYAALVKPLVPQVLKGFSAIVFAYGQTGSGKTFTIFGNPDADVSECAIDENAGIIPRALQQLFEELEDSDQLLNKECSIRISYLELYNEELFDMSASGAGKKIRIFDDSTAKGSVIISGLEEVPVNALKDVYQILRSGEESRKTASTLLNSTSSRSHCIVTATVATNRNQDLMRIGKLHFVDLAGSENIGCSGATGQRAREAGSIDQSLLTLGRVISALTAQADHVPYRESKVTRILQDSLGGKAITTLIAAISPSSVNKQETINTLEYAYRAKNVMNHPEACEEFSRRALLDAYRREMGVLKRGLCAVGKNSITAKKENYEQMCKELRQNRDDIADYADKIQAYASQIEKFVFDRDVMDLEYAKLYNRSTQLEERLKTRVSEAEELNLQLKKWKQIAGEAERNSKNLASIVESRDSDVQNLRKSLSHAEDKIAKLCGLITKVAFELQSYGHQCEQEVKIYMDSVESAEDDGSPRADEQCDVISVVEVPSHHQMKPSQSRANVALCEVEDLTGKSFCKKRESILDQPSNVLSPDSLKQTLLRPVQEADESSSDQQQFPANDAQPGNVRCVRGHARSLKSHPSNKRKLRKKH